MPRLRKGANISRQTANRRRDNYNAMIQQAVQEDYRINLMYTRPNQNDNVKYAKQNTSKRL